MDMIVIVDYGAGNVGNVARALRYLGLDWQIASTPANMPPDVELILLPGVGAFAPAAKKLEESGWRDTIIEWTRGGHPLLGICLGMQLLCECSFENDPAPASVLSRERCPNSISALCHTWDGMIYDGYARFLPCRRRRRTAARSISCTASPYP